MPSKDVCGRMHTRSLLNGVVNIFVLQTLSARHVCPYRLRLQGPAQSSGICQDTASLIGGGDTIYTHCQEGNQ